jgi:hypothetical protein
MSAPRVFAYQWTRNGVLIEGAVSSDYVVQVSDLGFQISAKVTASNLSGAVTVPAQNSLLIPSNVIRTRAGEEILDRADNYIVSR